MDLRGYGLPFNLGYSPYPRTRSDGVESDPSVPYDYQECYSFGDLSLSDDPPVEDMPHRCGSPKSKPSKSSSRSRDSKHHEPAKPLAAPRSHNPGIDVALRNLDQEVSTSLKTFQAFVLGFEGQIEPLQEWAEDFTLDTVWRNKVKDKFREPRDRERFEGVPERILGYRAAVKDAIRKAKTLKASSDDRYKIEGQIRTAKKAILYCDGIIELAERAVNERLACKQLVLELDEARCLLDRKRHPWIYGEEAIEEQSDDAKKGKDSRKSRSQKSRLSDKGLGSESFGARSESDRTERQDGLEYRFDNPPDPASEDAGKKHNDGEW